ncbi:unnamed protein product [[Actinomadura] parvosata subsp. kistnae]|nr:unnamed protein product [Actinomadura parvosata subsp. kistnae]
MAARDAGLSWRRGAGCSWRRGMRGCRGGAAGFGTPVAYGRTLPDEREDMR